MYCFPYPRASDVAPLRAPYVAEHIYSLTAPYSFEAYYKSIKPDGVPELRCGLARVPDTFGLCASMPSSVLQSWLFFGLASEALGRDIAHEEFFEKSTTSPAVALIDLRIPVWFWTELCDRWTRLRNELSNKAYKTKFKEFKECYNSAQMIVGFRDVSAQEADTEMALIILSVRMLLSTLNCVFGSNKPPQVSLKYKSTQFLMQKLLSNGWCRKRLNFIETMPLSYPALYFLSSFRHLQSNSAVHTSCTPVKCCVMTRLVEPLHRTRDCQCRDVTVSLEKVLNIVAAGGIPLIRIKRSPSGDFELEVIPYTSTIRFTAISHVWADRQLGSTKNALPACQVKYLDSILASLPRIWKDWRFYHIFPKASPAPNPIEPPSRTYEYFWLDTFCIPQDAQHADQKHKAIGLMNLIYAVAAQTVVFDAGLQSFDAGQRQSALNLFSQPTFYGPTDKNLLDVIAHICASNWMGRAWTLQEGVLSGNLVFPLNGSLAYLKRLMADPDQRLFSASDIPLIGPLIRLRKNSPPRIEDNMEPLWVDIGLELDKFLGDLLNVEEHGKYTRGTVARAEMFVNAHIRLQSRTTTMEQDLPLILMNMSAMNGNLVSQSDSLEQKMKLLCYGLGSLPIELLFSDCARLGSCEVDAWIPREVVPEKFSGEFALRLSSEGFVFNSLKDKIRLRFYVTSDPIVWESEWLFCLPSGPDSEERYYTVQDPMPSPPLRAENGWCFLLEDDGRRHRAARFIITRRVKNKVFLHFDRSLRLQRRVDSAANMEIYLTKYVCTPRVADARQEFIIEKADAPQTLGMARPQNPEQNVDRLNSNSRAFIFVSVVANTYLMKWLFGGILGNGYLPPILHIVTTFMLVEAVDQALRTFLHYAWIETYSPNWNAEGVWRLFWRVVNYEPPGFIGEIVKNFLMFKIGTYLFKSVRDGMALLALYVWFNHSSSSWPNIATLMVLAVLWLHN